MDKQFLVRQLESTLRDQARIARSALKESNSEVERVQAPGERSESTRELIEQSSMAKAQGKRAHAALTAANALQGFHPKMLNEEDKIVVGAIVELEDEDTGEGKTVFLMPVGAGSVLTGPDGDGFLSVITPASPMGKAILGKRCGDVVDITLRGDCREWLITFVG